MAGSNRREALATHAAAIGQRGLAALGGITIQETVLPLAADFRRLILAFHNLINSINRSLPMTKYRVSRLTKSAKG
jgi:hypothetical protein